MDPVVGTPSKSVVELNLCARSFEQMKVKAKAPVVRLVRRTYVVTLVKSRERWRLTWPLGKKEDKRFKNERGKKCRNAGKCRRKRRRVSGRKEEHMVRDCWDGVQLISGELGCWWENTDVDAVYGSWTLSKHIAALYLCGWQSNHKNYVVKKSRLFVYARKYARIIFFSVLHQKIIIQ